MDVAEFFSSLSYGELSNLALSGEGSGEIIAEKQPKIFSYLNEGLLKLYSRFVIKSSRLLLEMQPHISNYRLVKANARTNSSPLPDQTLFILDTVIEPFLGDVIRILSVNGQNGFEYRLNDENRNNSFFTPQPDTLQIPSPIGGKILSVVYQAKHVPLILLSNQIYIPDVLEEALRAYVSHKVYLHMNGPENAAQATNYLGIYEQACVEAEQYNLVNTSIITSSYKFFERGWV